MALIVGGAAGVAGKAFLSLFALVLIAGCARQAGEPVQKQSEISADLVALARLAPGVREDVRYMGSHNFMGRPVAGYEGAQCWLSRPAAQSLARYFDQPVRKLQ